MMIPSTMPLSRVVILCATDLSEASKEALAAAVRFANLPGGELHLLHVSNKDLDDRETVDAIAERMERDLRAAGSLQRVGLHVSYGAPWRVIAQIAADLRADLLVVGTHARKGLKRAFLGSVASSIVERAPCPVYVARPVDHSLAHPEIEPPCPDCVAVQFETRGATHWCARHSEKHVHGHLHYSTSVGFGQGNQFIHT